MTWYDQANPSADGGGAGGGGGSSDNAASAGERNRQSFSSRITNFSDIADISIDHLQFDDGATSPSGRREKQQLPPPPQPHHAPTSADNASQVPTASTAYQNQQQYFQPQESLQHTQAQPQYGGHEGQYGRATRSESTVSALSSAPYSAHDSGDLGRSDTTVSTFSNSTPGQNQHALRQTGSNISLQSQYDENGTPLHGRDSIVSLQSYYDPPTAQQDAYNNQEHSYATEPTSLVSSWTGMHPSGYAPVTASPTASAGRTQSRNNSYSSSSRGGRTYSLAFSGEHEAIQEEEYDMALLPAASPMGRTSQHLDESRPAQGTQGAAAEPAFDMTTSLGPMSLQDAEFVKKLQEQEAQGHLTGGLGTGFKPETTLLGSELLKSPTSALSPTGLTRSLTRTLTRRATKRRSGTNEEFRQIGQEEANRRGEVIEVVVDEPTGVDISAMVGPDVGGDNVDDSQSTRNTVLPTWKTTQTFYPQPNWKPFSMRWPYLTALIFLSIGLAVMQELLYQKSQRSPLLTFTNPDDVPAGIYFAIKFVPTIIAVTFGVLWQVTDFEVKRLEAFYQLSKPGGALAGESINVDYITSKAFLRPILAIKLRHWAVAVSSFATLLAVSLVPTFGAASIKLTPGRQERNATPDVEKHIVINKDWSRLLTVTLVFCAVSGCVLFYLLQTRRTGLQNDVKGIAGLASMAVVSHILMDFKDMDTAKHEDIHHKLKHRRYILRNSALAPDDDNPESVQARDANLFQHAHLSDNPHPVMMRAAGFVPFVVAVFLFIGFIPVFLFTGANVVAEKAPWVITALAVAIKLSWNTLDTDIRMMEPFYILSRRHAPSKTLTLDYAAMPFGYLPWRAFLNGDRIMFLVGVGSVIAEILTVLLTSLATVEGRSFIDAYAGGDGNDDNKDDDDDDTIHSGQETTVSFWVSLTFAVLILLYLAVVSTLVFVRRRHPFLPRQPNTISSILAYIHQSKMLYGFVGTSKLNNAEMVTMLAGDEKTYGLGLFQGRDGKTHCGVDQEELISHYKHGQDVGQINKPWEQQWDVF